MALTFLCSSCGHDITATVVMYLPAATLAEARTAIGDAGVAPVTCAVCGQHNTPDAPLLIQVNELALPLCFVPATGTTPQEDGAQLEALLDTARAASGDAWQTDWTSHIFGAQRPEVTRVLAVDRLKRRDVPEGLDAALLALRKAADWYAVAAIIRASPVLLTDVVFALIDEQVASLRSIGRDERDRLSDRDVLEQCRAHGVDAVADAHLDREPPELAAQFSALQALAAGIDAGEPGVEVPAFISAVESLLAAPAMASASVATMRSLRRRAAVAYRALSENPQHSAPERRAALERAIAHQQVALTLAALCDLDELADCGNTLGRMRRELFMLGGGDQQMEYAVEDWRGVVSRDPAFRARATLMAGSNLGSALREAFRATGDETLLAESLAVHERAVAATAAEDPLLHMRLNNLANAVVTRYSNAGQAADLELAMRIWQSALQRTPEGQQNDKATYLGHLASAYHLRYQQNGALEDLERSIEFQQSATLLSDKSSESYIYRLQALGHVLMTRYGVSRDEQDLYAGLRLYEEALGIVPTESPERPSIVDDLAAGLLMRYRHQDQVSDLRRAIELLRSSLAQTPDGHVDRDNRLIGLAEALAFAYNRRHDREFLDEAIALFRQAAAIAQAGSRTLALRRLGHALRLRAEQTGGEADATEGIEAYRAAATLERGASTEEAMQAAVELGDWQALRGEWPASAVAFGLAMERVDALFEEQGERRTREALLASAQGIAARAGYASARAGDAVEAAHRIERGRTRLLLDDLEEEQWGIAKLPALGYGELSERYHAAVARVGQVERDVTSSGSFLEARAASEDRRTALVAARTDLRSVRSEIRSLPAFAQSSAPLSSSDIVGLVTPGDAIAFVVTTSYGALAVLVTSGAATSVMLDLDDAALRDLMIRRKPWDEMSVDEQVEFGGEHIRSYRFPSVQSAIATTPVALSAFRHDGFTADAFGERADDRPLVGGLLSAHLGAVPLAQALDETLAVVGARIMLPLTTAVTQMQADGTRIDRLVLVTGGLLSFIPLHAAPFESAGVQRSLLDRVDVICAPSARVFATARLRAEQVPARIRLAVIANPRPDTHPLPYAAVESALAVGRFPSDSPVLLQHEEATLERVHEAVAGATHVHFATHGLFRPEAPLSSYLELADQDQVVVGDMLAAQWFVGTRVVTFSACETGLTDVRFLPDEALGLPAAGIRAGAACVIGSLWPVRDLVAALLMGQFYKALGGSTTSPAGALRHAQLWLRDLTSRELLIELDDVGRWVSDAGMRASLQALAAALRRAPADTRPFAHPEHWGAWVATGA